MAASCALPLPLQKAINSLPFFVSSIAKARPGLIRSMRSERQAAMIKFLTALLLSTSLQHDGAVCYVSEKWAKPKTLEELAEDSGISYASAKRCMALLTQLDYLTSKQIRRKNKVNGQLEVSPGLRFLTRKFWQSVGLWELYKQSVAWAKKHIRHCFYLPFKAVKQAENTVKQVGSIMDDVLKTMRLTVQKEKTEGQKKAKFWCNKILTELRQNHATLRGPSPYF